VLKATRRIADGIEIIGGEGGKLHFTATRGRCCGR